MPTARLSIGFHLLEGDCRPPRCTCECSGLVEHNQHVPGRRSDIGVDRRGLPWQYDRGLGNLIYTAYLVEAGPLGAFLDLGPRVCPHTIGEPPCPRLGGELDVVM